MLLGARSRDRGISDIACHVGFNALSYQPMLPPPLRPFAERVL
jgi:hypothetical protein